jgi:hypothetical protein
MTDKNSVHGRDNTRKDKFTVCKSKRKKKRKTTKKHQYNFKQTSIQLSTQHNNER